MYTSVCHMFACLNHQARCPRSTQSTLTSTHTKSFLSAASHRAADQHECATPRGGKGQCCECGVNIIGCAGPDWYTYLRATYRTREMHMWRSGRSSTAHACSRIIGLWCMLRYARCEHALDASPARAAVCILHGFRTIWIISFCSLYSLFHW